MFIEKEKKWIHSKDLFFAIEGVLAQGRQAVYTVTGMSMWPFLCPGRDQVILVSCESESIQKGDIVLIRTYLGNYLLQRVIKATKNGFEIMGDGYCFRSGYFPNDCLRAKVVRVIRKEREIECTARRWKILSICWIRFRFIRPLLLWMIQKSISLKNKIKR